MLNFKHLATLLPSKKSDNIVNAVASLKATNLSLEKILIKLQYFYEATNDGSLEIKIIEVVNKIKEKLKYERQSNYNGTLMVHP